MMSESDWQKFEETQRWKILRRTRVRNYIGRLSSAQSFICAICGFEITGDPTIDHVIPRARNGFDGVGNIVAAHFDCNNRKADRLPTGCELVFLLAVNARLGVEPQRW